MQHTQRSLSLFAILVLSFAMFMGNSSIFSVQNAFAVTDKEEVDLESSASTRKSTKTTDDETDEDQEDEEVEATDSSETTANLKNRIKKIVDEKNEEVKGAVDDLSLEKRGFIGSVMRVTEESITVKNNEGTNIVPFDSTVFLYKDDEKTTLDKVAVDDWAIVMGFIIDDTFEPKKILVSSKTLRPKNHFVQIGTIEEINKNDITFKSRSSESSDTLTISKAIKYQDNLGDEAEKTDFDENTQALVIGYEDDGSSSVTVIRALAPFDIEEE